jgi:tRNA G10  N-methylase Trm11
MSNRIIDNSWDFRYADTKEYTHCYHAYPAMMIPQVARKLIEEFRPEGKCELIFDPYMGSGTTLVEANIAGIKAVGTDINPLARLISSSKIQHFDIELIEKCTADILLFNFRYTPEIVLNKDFSRISNYSFWYSEDSLLKLSYISQYIETLPNEIRLFFNIALSEVVRECSFTRNGEFKRFRMSSKQLEKFNPDVFGLFVSKVERNLNGLRQFNEANNSSYSTIHSFNTVYNIPEDILPQNSVDMIVTSPPYGDSRTTVAYGQFSRWANEWFGFEEAKNIDNLLMGGKKQEEENFETKSIKSEIDLIKELDGKRYKEVIAFLNDYHNSIKNISSRVRQGGRVCYVVGNRNVRGVQIPLDYFTVEMFEKYAFIHEQTIVRGIPNKRMPSKTSPTNIAGNKVATMSNEYIVILTKQRDED